MVNYRYKEEGSDDEFMPEVLAAEHMRQRRMAPLLLYSVVGALLSLLLWSALATIDEITRGEGKVIPSNLIQKVNHLEGGIIRKVLVHEGDIVEKGQILLQIDNTVAEAKYHENKTLYYRNLAAVARLRAQISGKPLEMPKEVLEKAPSEAEDAERNYKTRMENLHDEVRIATHEVEQKRQELNEQIGRAKELETQSQLIDRKIHILEPLVAKQIEPEIMLLDLKKEASQIRADLASVKSRILQAQAAVEQAKQKMEQVPIKFKAEDWNEFREISNRLANTQQTFISEKDRASRTDVRSPMRGIIKQIHATTVGEVIQPGGPLLEIVPLEDTLLIEAKINPRDIAFLRPGLTASVKLTAYDYSVYGDIKAELVRISADSITEKENGKDTTFFLVYLRTKGTKLSKAGNKQLPIIPGMTASVDIITGKKSVLTYLLKPLIKAKSEALTER